MATFVKNLKALDKKIQEILKIWNEPVFLKNTVSLIVIIV